MRKFICIFLSIAMLFTCMIFSSSAQGMNSMELQPMPTDTSLYIIHRVDTGRYPDRRCTIRIFQRRLGYLLFPHSSWLGNIVYVPRVPRG